MKRFWQTCMAVVVTAAMANTANAQWNEPSEIGSYQSILSRAGYGEPNGTAYSNGNAAGYNSYQPAPGPPGATMGAAQDCGQGGRGMVAGPGCAPANCGGGGYGGSSNYGGQMMGGQMNGQSMGGQMNGQMMNGQMMGGQMMGGQTMGGTMQGSVGNGMGSTAGCGTGNYLSSGSNGAAGYGAAAYGGGAYGGGVSYGAAGYGGPGYGNGGYNAPVYNPGRAIGGGENSNWVLGVYGLSFRRDYDDGQRIARNAGGAALYTDDLDHGDMNGVGVSLIKRSCGGSGWEAVFWGIDEETDISLAGSTTTYLTGLAAVAHPPSGATVLAIYDTGDNIRVYRDTDIYNFEFNLLRNGGAYTTRGGRSANYEMSAGFRLFKFDESFRYVSYSSVPAYPATIEYALEAENTLTGFQLGGRNEICLSNRFRLACAGSAGVFNNYIETRQQIIDSNAYSAMDYSDTKNDAAMMGQLDLGLIYQISCKARARIGYRALGVAGVALAEDQIPMDFTDTRALNSANSNGDLLLHGFYYGGEFCF